MRYQHAKMRLKDGVRYKGTVHYKEIREKDSDVYLLLRPDDIIHDDDSIYSLSENEVHIMFDYEY